MYLRQVWPAAVDYTKQTEHRTWLQPLSSVQDTHLFPLGDEIKEDWIYTSNALNDIPGRVFSLSQGTFYLLLPF